MGGIRGDILLNSYPPTINLVYYFQSFRLRHLSVIYSDFLSIFHPQLAKNTNFGKKLQSTPRWLYHQFVFMGSHFYPIFTSPSSKYPPCENMVDVGADVVNFSRLNTSQIAATANMSEGNELHTPLFSRNMEISRRLLNKLRNITQMKTMTVSPLPRIISRRI